jgi:hypothetical protein
VAHLHPRVPVSRHSLFRTSGRGWDRALGRLRAFAAPLGPRSPSPSGTAATMPSLRRSTGSARPRSARPMAQLRSRRIRYARVGRLFQQPPPPRLDRPHPAGRGRSRSRLLCGQLDIITGRVANENQPPADPGRFNPLRPIERDNADLVRGCPLSLLVTSQTPAWRIAKPSGAGIHPFSAASVRLAAASPGSSWMGRPRTSR